MGQTTFRDARGVEWRVCEVSLGQLARLPAHRRVLPGLRHGWLCFESGREKRRLAPYPAGWRAISDRELAALWECAVRVPTAPASAAALLTTRTGPAPATSVRERTDTNDTPRAWPGGLRLCTCSAALRPTAGPPASSR